MQLDYCGAKVYSISCGVLEFQIHMCVLWIQFGYEPGNCGRPARPGRAGDHLGWVTARQKIVGLLKQGPQPLGESVNAIARLGKWLRDWAGL